MDFGKIKSNCVRSKSLKQVLCKTIIRINFERYLKYFPFTPSKSGCKATWRDVCAPLIGVLTKGHNKNFKICFETLEVKIGMCRTSSVSTTPGCKALEVTFVP